MSAIRVLLADDSADLRFLVRETLEAHGGFVVEGEAGDGEEAIARAAELQPELVLLDLDMPRLGGLDALPGIRSAAPGARVIVLSGLRGDARDASLAGGAVGFLEKGIKASDLVGELLALAGALELVSDAVIEHGRGLGMDATTPRAARKLVEAALDRWNCRHALDTVALLASEVVTNAVLHGRSEIDVAVRLLPRTIRVEVTDRSRAGPRPRRAAADAESGRGLALVEGLASSWGSDPLPAGQGKVVWFEVARLDERSAERPIA